MERRIGSLLEFNKMSKAPGRMCWLHTTWLPQTVVKENSYRVHGFQSKLMPTGPALKIQKTGNIQKGERNRMTLAGV